jgi:hypothetical protein
MAHITSGIVTKVAGDLGCFDRPYIRSISIPLFQTIGLERERHSDVKHDPGYTLLKLFRPCALSRIRIQSVVDTIRHVAEIIPPR